jgi:hypothetical protein
MIEKIVKEVIKIDYKKQTGTKISDVELEKKFQELSKLPGMCW